MNNSVPYRPLVSVIIPFLNEEQFIEETIESVLQQEYTNWELLLVDDGSTNNSTRIAKAFAAMYPDKIFYLEHKCHVNKGLTASRNLGVQHAKGTLIALLDADDKWLPQKLSHQVYLFGIHPEIAMVAEASVYWNTWCDSSKRDIKVPVGAQEEKVYKPLELLQKLYPLHIGAAPVPCALMIKKQAILQVGGFESSFVKQFQLYEDQALLSKLYLNFNVYISSSCNNLYRQRPGSIVKEVKGSGQYHAVRKYFLEWLHAYTIKNGFLDDTLDKLLKKALFPYHHPTLYLLTYTFPNQVVQLSKKAVPGPLKDLIKKQLHLVK
ncbi:glycosyltransferase family 2 protein [Pontibacter qinzhouensis]|uniref:Glycosyltransferase family 2 protein n=1 Tax=Pontibacter qinzhouensis TaxID=2603253 RepID=A0A5C8IQL0_9BACT|nr:glycosyltransferase family 2 protein [Pontibacter qinzhouensis]TXK23334.1 glycosyltransferase family 2 protein [Pontibacter qinzhouensis]